MPALKGETQEQKASRYNIRAAEFQRKASLARVSDCMKHRPDSIAGVERYLEDNGFMAMDGTPVSSSHAPPTKSKLSAEPVKSSSEVKLPEPGSGSSFMAPLVEPPSLEPKGETDAVQTPWDKNVTHYGNASIQLMERALQSVNGAIFTDANMREIKMRGARLKTQKKLAEYIEYVSDIDGDSPIAPDSRSEEGYIDSAVSAARSKGDRATRLVLPCKDWGVGGHYTHDRIEKTVVKVKQVCTEKVITLECPATADLYIDVGFSLARAFIRDMNSDWRVMLSLRFEKPEDSSTAPHAKKAKKNLPTPKAKSEQVAVKTPPSKQPKSKPNTETTKPEESPPSVKTEIAMPQTQSQLSFKPKIKAPTVKRERWVLHFLFRQGMYMYRG
eukprot:TRINITY_DN62823_c0_g1_i1.p1 TRINITY_DN62823_c0_g1~~TRINITY_DN62823_c0_g1_i1.p1  ORF type:complete len:386 (-),score=66.56 TRINITY_DN62823_c0_g1_i1:51-1208(-)